MSPDDPRHGTSAGYDAERRAGLPYCRPCRDAAAQYEYDRRIGRILGEQRTTPGLGTARRVQALVAAGWTFRDIGAAVGKSHDHARKVAFQGDTVIRTATAARFLAAFETLGGTQPPTDTPSQRKRVSYARSVAARHGWVTANRWDDIDNPTEQPDPGYVDAPRDPNEIDAVVIDRLLAGDLTLARAATKAERIAVVLSWPGSLAELARDTGWNTNYYRKAAA